MREFAVPLSCSYMAAGTLVLMDDPTSRHALIQHVQRDAHTPNMTPSLKQSSQLQQNQHLQTLTRT